MRLAKTGLNTVECLLVGTARLEEIVNQDGDQACFTFTI